MVAPEQKDLRKPPEGNCSGGPLRLFAREDKGKTQGRDRAKRSQPTPTPGKICEGGRPGEREAFLPRGLW